MFVLLGIFLTSCSSKAPSGDSTQGLILGGNVLYPENEPTSIVLKKGKNSEILSDVDDYPSRPEVSPDQAKMAYIAPFEFEMAGDVWMYIFSSGEKLKLIMKEAFGADCSVKKLLWADNDHLLVLVGNKVGTVSSNRELYVYDQSSNISKSILKTDENQDIQDLAIHANHIEFNMATYNDDSSDFTKEPYSYSIDDLLAIE
ncbi:DUF4652 domain-containing protein [Paenibacillus castaneae]|nr:DUF4652 domain-containing protein [Paenibacillus castaneae]